MLLQVLSSCRILSAPVVTGSDGGDGDYQVCSLRLMSTAGDSLSALSGCCSYPTSGPSALPVYNALHTAPAYCKCMQSPPAAYSDRFAERARAAVAAYAEAPPPQIPSFRMMHRLAPSSEGLLKVIVHEGCAEGDFWQVLLCLQSPSNPRYP